MPYAVSLPLQYDGASLPQLHRALHANLYTWFAAADPDLADDLHCQPVRKPFALSPLMRHGKDGYVLRVALLRVSLRVVKARKLGEEILRQLNALADYAEFCGTGRKTTHGMGQTRRYSRAEFVSDGGEAPCPMP